MKRKMQMQKALKQKLKTVIKILRVRNQALNKSVFHLNREMNSFKIRRGRIDFVLN